MVRTDKDMAHSRKCIRCRSRFPPAGPARSPALFGRAFPKRARPHFPTCLHEWLPREEILTYEETLRIIRIATDLGVSKVRVTGGEPLTRRGVLDFVRALPKISGIHDLGLSTNGTLLARQTDANVTMATAL